MGTLRDQIRERWLEKMRSDGAVDPELLAALERGIADRDDVIDRRELVAALENVEPSR